MWPKGRFSCIAGFLEPSESIEETAYREVLEEAGVPVGRITYHSSQPWPFPSQLMVGCHAQAMTEDVRPIDSELEEVKWFTKEEIRVALANHDLSQLSETSLSSHPQLTDLTLAPAQSLAHQLIKSWVDGQAGVFS